MASIAQLIGRRPAKYSFGQGLGAALEVGGKYYGELAIQQRNAQALAEARAYDEKVQAARDVREDGIRADEAARREAEILGERAYQDGVRADTRAYNEEQLEEERAYAASLTADTRAYNEGQNAEALAQGSITESRVAEDGSVHKYRLDTNGNVVADLGPDPDFGVDAEGNIVRASAGGRIATDDKRTEAQLKYGIHGKNLQSGLAVVQRVLGDGYDLQKFQAFSDQVAGAFGGFGNWVTSPQGRAYQAGVTRAAEALFKGESGAAGSDAESARYQSMFPRPGDDPAVVQVKYALLNESVKAFEQASGLPRDDQVMFVRAQADALAAENGFVITDGGVVSLDSLNGRSRSTLSAEDADLFQRYGLTPP